MSRFLYRAGWPDRQNPKHPHRWRGRSWLYIGPWVVGNVGAWDRSEA